MIRKSSSISSLFKEVVVSEQNSEPNSTKKRCYSEEYLKLGFTCIISGGVEKPQCVICSMVLSSESLKPSKLKRHLETNHPACVNMDVEYFRQKERNIKRQRLDFTGDFQPQSTGVIQASFEIAYQIAINKKPHTIGEKLVKPCMLKAVKLILGDVSAKKMQQLFLSDKTIRRRISKMSIDVKEQIINEVKNSPLFSFQLDESTDVASCAQLLVFVRYIHRGDIKEEFLFCHALEEITKADDIMKTVKNFFTTEELLWDKL